MNDREYARLRATIEADYRRKLDALELIYGMTPKASTAAPSTLAITPIKGELTQAAIKAVQQAKGEFNIRDIEQLIKVTNGNMDVKRGSLSNILKRLEGKEIEVIEKGSGKRPTKYRRLRIVEIA